MTDESLILADEQEKREETALFNFYGLEAPLKVDKSKLPFHCTGERLMRDRPEVYRTAVEMWAEGLSKRKICRVCHMDDATLNSVIAREEIPITAHKKAIGAKSGRVANMLLDRVEELAPTMSAKDAIIGFGVVTEKHLLTTGDVTSRVEFTPAVNIIAKFEDFCVELGKRVEAREIGFQDQKKLTKGGDDSPVTEAEIVPQSDSTTDVPSHSPKVIERTANDLANEPPAAADVDESPSRTGADGGGGGAAPGASPQISDP